MESTQLKKRQLETAAHTHTHIHRLSTHNVIRLGWCCKLQNAIHSIHMHTHIQNINTLQYIYFIDTLVIIVLHYYTLSLIIKENLIGILSITFRMSDKQFRVITLTKSLYANCM